MIGTVVPRAVAVQRARVPADVHAAMEAEAVPNVPVAVAVPNVLEAAAVRTVPMAAAATALAAMVAPGVRETGTPETVVRTAPTKGR
ncbi:hypothetical protein ACIQCD_17420 [Streptomyces sp. NPDC093250]|uniref:hypothetical protein n=1 Tax=unclassified Streptomyces TaxID=2593676 RepID=UPI0034260F34